MEKTLLGLLRCIPFNRATLDERVSTLWRNHGDLAAIQRKSLHMPRHISAHE